LGAAAAVADTNAHKIDLIFGNDQMAMSEALPKINAESPDERNTEFTESEKLKRELNQLREPLS
jgi:hypothetical protein